MTRFEREIRRRTLAKKKRKAFAIYGKYTKDDDLLKCECKRHRK